MHRIDGAGHVDHQFVAEDVDALRAPTEVTAEWLNAVQEELIAVIEEAGIDPSKLDNGQLLAALQKSFPRESLRNYADLRGYRGPAVRICLDCRDHLFDGGGGDFYLTDGGIDNDITIIVDALGRSWRRDYKATILLSWAGVTEGVDNTDRIHNAIALLPESGGEIVIDMPGRYPANLLINRSNTRLRGGGKGGYFGVGSREFGLVPFDYTKPVVQVADDSGIVGGCELSNLSIWRDTPDGVGGYYGLRLHGGCVNFTVTNVTVGGFMKRPIWIQPGVNHYVTYIYFHGLSTYLGTNPDADCAVFIARTVEQYCTAIYFSNSHLQSTNASPGRALEIDGVVVGFSNTWIQVGVSGGGVKIADSTGHGAFIFGSNTQIDSDNTSDILVECTIPAVGYRMTSVLSGSSFTCDGRIKFWDGTVFQVDGSDAFSTSGRHRAARFIDRCYITESANPSLIDLNFIRIGSDLYWTSPGSISHQVGAAGSYVFGFGGAGGYSMTQSAFSPGTDNVKTLGVASNRFSKVFTAEVRLGDGSIKLTSAGGAPEGLVTGNVGSIYTRSDGAGGTTLYIKEFGTGNTGWVAK